MLLFLVVLWKEVSVDFVEILNKEYFFLIIDDYFRYFVVEIVKLIVVIIIILKFDKVFLEFGVLDVVRFDNGFLFNSKEFVVFVDDFGFKY